MYLYKEKAYTASGLFDALDLPQDTLINEQLMREAGVTKLKMLIPNHDEQWQYLTHDGAILDPIKQTYTPAVVTIRRYALVNHHGMVVDLSNTPADGWIPVPYQLNKYIASITWIYDDDNETFKPAADIPTYLALERKKALTLIAEKHAEMLVIATGGATTAECDTWIIKELAARDVIAGGTGGGVLRPVGGEKLEQLAHKILTKSQDYRMLVGVADEIKRTAEKAVEAVTLQTIEDLTALEAVLESAKAMTEGALQQAQGTAQ